MANLPLKQYYRWMFLPGILLLVLPSLVRAYFLMPFPGSQDMETMNLAYYIELFLWPSRILALLLIALPILNVYFNGHLKGRVWISVLLLLIGGIFYFTEIYSSAEHMFLEPKQKMFSDARGNKVPMEKLVVGVEINGESKAYPINYIAYHHKIQDSVGGKAILVTFCSMCHTGRIYDPVIDGIHQEFRLVGARHYDAIIEDNETGSWWYQATGVSGAGPRKGKELVEIPSEQMMLSQWIELHPKTLIMQPDPNFTDEYAGLESYDRYQSAKTGIETEVLGWQKGIWVVGVISGTNSRAYRWNDIVKLHSVNDQVGGQPILLAIANDSLSFTCFSRRVDGEILEFHQDSSGKGLIDNCNCRWNFKGECTEGKYQGKKLQRLRAYQEFWRSWKQFHPETTQWKS